MRFPPPPPLTLDMDVVGLEAVALLPAQQLAEAMRHGALLGAEWLRARWIARAIEEDVVDAGTYVQALQAEGAIRVVSSRLSGGEEGPDALWEVVLDVTCSAAHASIVEDGHGAFHLPSKVNWSGPNVKTTKAGTPYLSIPFRHGTPAGGGEGATHARLRALMPHDVLQQAKALARRVRENAGRQFDAQGHFRAVDKYHWEGRGRHRLQRRPGESSAGPGGVVMERRDARTVGWVQVPGGRAPLTNPAWKTSKFEGLMKTGPARHTAYMTIRTMTPASEGWNIPAQAGHGLARAVAADGARNPDLQEIVTGGILQAITGGQP